MESVNVNFAYDGFLYAPLFLAEELGVFQKRMSLKYREGDEATINKLAIPVDPDDHGRNWFAICDPFAKDITAVQRAIGPRDQVCIVAAFIHRLPVWMYYNGKAQFSVCNDESGMSAQRREVENLRCYRQYNTGYLVGERVRSLFDLASDRLVQCDFGAEFGTNSEPLLPKTLVVTSDILKLIKANDFNDGRVVFSYAQRVSDLNPFLFTAILTLKSVIDGHLDAVLSLLSGLRLAAGNIREPGNLQTLAGHYKGFSPANVQEAVNVLTEEAVYSTDFDLEQVARAYENARLAWQKVKPNTHFAEIEKCREPIPCLLLKNGWHTDKTLVDLLVKKWQTDPGLVAILAKGVPERPINPLKNKYQILLAVGLAILTVVGGLVLVNGSKKVTEGNLGYWLICAFIFLIQVVCSVILAWNVVKKFEMKGFEFLAGTILAMFGLLLSTVTWIVK